MPNQKHLQHCYILRTVSGLAVDVKGISLISVAVLEMNKICYSLIHGNSHWCYALLRLSSDYIIISVLGLLLHNPVERMFWEEWSQRALSLD